MSDAGNPERPDASVFRLVFRRLVPYALRYRWRLLSILCLSALTAGGQKLLILFIDPTLEIIFPGQSTARSQATGVLGGVEGSVQEFRTWFLRQALGGDAPTDPDGLLAALTRIFLIILFFALLTAFAQYLYVVAARNLGLKMVTDLRRDVCEHLLRLSMRYHGERKMGDLLSRLTTDVTASLRSINIFFEDLIQFPFLILYTFFLAFYGSPLLTFVILALIPLIAIPIGFFARKVRKGSYRSSTALGTATTTMEQMLSGIRVVKAFQLEEKEIEGLDQANRSFLRKSMQMVRAKAATEGFLILFTIGGTALALVGIGFAQVQWQLFGQIGQATVFLASVTAVYQHVKQFTRFWYTVLESSGSGLRLFQILDLQPEVVTAKGAQPIDGVRQGIEFRNIHFAYDKEPVLSGVQFQAKAGSRIAIVGPSGAGKSTLLDLIARFYDPRQGEILVDGRELRTIRTDSWLRQIAVVSQQPFLFNISIRENIRYGRAEASDEEILSAARAANVDEFARTLPDGYDTIVGERGVKLSGGQLQRITIARAIVKNASVLLLDEATSSLDSESERQVQSALDNLMKGKTTFVIAHRLSTVRNADRILVLDKGRLVEQGTHPELVSRNGLYKRLYDLQFADSVA